MDFERSEMQEMLIDSAARLLGERAGVDYWREQRGSADGFERARWDEFAKLGWLALPLPEAAGGLDGSVEDVALLNIELGRALATEPFVSTTVLAGTVIARGMNDDRAVPLLSTIAQGHLRIALAHDETGADPLSPTALGTNARRARDGYLLSGEKLMVMDAPSAHSLIVSARIDGEDGTALLLVDSAAAGVTIDDYPLVDGTRAADITLRNVAVPAVALIAGGSSGTSILAEAVDRASIALMAQAVGSMEACLKICGDYARERSQFGVPIVSFQAIQHLLADMFVSAHQARSMLYHALAHAEDPPPQRSAAISAARLIIGQASQLVSRNGIQIHGGYGLTDEYPISHHYRRLMVLEKSFGDSARHAARFAATLFH